MDDQAADLLHAADQLLLFGEVEEALARLDQAVLAAPDAPLPYCRRAELLIRLGTTADLQAAREDLHRAIALGMDTPGLYFTLMRTLIELGDLPAARAAYGRAVALAPADARLREWGVRLALQDGDTAGALTLVRAERAAAPENFHWARWEVELLLLSGDDAGARRALDALIAAPMPFPAAWDAAPRGDLYLKRAAACRRLGDLAAARADLEQAAACVPGDPALAFERGLLIWMDGDPDGAYPALLEGLRAARAAVQAGFWAELAAYPRQDDLRRALR